MYFICSVPLISWQTNLLCWLILLITKPSTTMWAYTDNRTLTYSIIRYTMRGYFPSMVTNLVRVAFDDFTVVLVWEYDLVVSFIAKFNRGLQRWTTVACLLSFQEHIWVIGRSSRTTQRGILISFTHYTKERLFQNNNGQQEQNALDEYIHFNHHESWAAPLTSVTSISLTLRWRLARMSMETVGLRHYHYHYHYHPCTNPLYCLQIFAVSLTLFDNFGSFEHNWHMSSR